MSATQETKLEAIEDAIKELVDRVDDRAGVTTSDLGKIQHQLDDLQRDVSESNRRWIVPLAQGVVSGFILLLITALFLFVAPVNLPNVTISVGAAGAAAGTK